MATAYCMKCWQKREIKHPKQITLKNNKLAVQGTCSVCETKLFRIGKLLGGEILSSQTMYSCLLSAIISQHNIVSARCKKGVKYGG